jgi:hypothetical protein
MKPDPGDFISFLISIRKKNHAAKDPLRHWTTKEIQIPPSYQSAVCKFQGTKYYLESILMDI